MNISEQDAEAMAVAVLLGWVAEARERARDADRTPEAVGEYITAFLDVIESEYLR